MDCHCPDVNIPLRGYNYLLVGPWARVSMRFVLENTVSDWFWSSPGLLWFGSDDGSGDELRTSRKVALLIFHGEEEEEESKL